MPAIAKRTTERAHSRLLLSEELAESQVRKGLHTVQAGVTIPIPVDDLKRPTHFLNRGLWVKSAEGIHRPGAKFMPSMQGTNSRQKRILGWLRDNVNENIPHLYYKTVLGHDLHVSTWGRLYAKHWHRGWANPFNPEQNDAPLNPMFEHDCDKPTCEIRDGLLPFASHWGFTEALGLLSQGKVTDAFVSEEIDELVSATSSEYADFDFHEVGTSNTAEDNNDTALGTSSGITRVTGTPTDADPIYRNVGTVTADATETWEEHGLFNNLTSVALMDRSLTGGQAVNSSDQVEYTYELTKNPEA